MTDTLFPAGLSDVADKYNTIFCDVWGVIHNGRKAFGPACDALVKFREDGKRVVLITNAPVPKAQVIHYFDRLGVPEAAFDDCASSGDATRNILKARSDEKIWRLGADEGWEHDRFLYEGLDLTFTEPEDASILLCIGLRDQGKDHPDDYREELGLAVASKLEMICANPDKQVRIGGELYWCAGALAEIYEEQGGSVVYPGKPHAAIYDLAREKTAALGGVTDPARCLCIGDSPTTDIRGANHQAMDSVYVGTGLKDEFENFEGEVRALFAEHAVNATYAMPGLKW